MGVQKKRKTSKMFDMIIISWLAVAASKLLHIFTRDTHVSNGVQMTGSCNNINRWIDSKYMHLVYLT